MLIELMTGRDVMGSHTADDVVIWHHLPYWNGTWGMKPSHLLAVKEY